MRKYLLAVLFATVVSCARDDIKKMDFKYTATIDKIEMEVPFDELVESYRYVQLETSPDCLIGEIEQVLFNKDQIYIISDGIYCFNHKGKFLFAINKKGKGPSEFIRINSVSLSERTLYLYDNLQWRILAFDSNTGSFKEEIKMPYATRRSFVKGNYIISDCIFHPNTLAKNDDRIILTEKKNPNNLCETYFSGIRHKIDIENQITTCETGIIFSDYYSCNAYKITDSGIEGYLKLEMDADKRLTEKDIDGLSKNGEILANTEEQKRKIMGLANVQENKDFIFARFISNNQFVFTLLDKITKKNRTFKYIQTKEYQISPLALMYGNNDVFCAVISNGSIELIKKELDEGKNLSNKDPEYLAQKTLRQKTLEDNPIIAFYKFKRIAR